MGYTGEKANEYARQYRKRNKETQLKYWKDYRNKNIAKIRKYQRQYRKFFLYGLTEKDLAKLLLKAQYRCNICKRHQDELTQSLVVDHCHKTKKIRGILCAKCNLGIGYFNDNPELLQAAKRYLK